VCTRANGCVYIWPIGVWNLARPGYPWKCTTRSLHKWIATYTSFTRMFQKGAIIKGSYRIRDISKEFSTTFIDKCKYSYFVHDCKKNYKKISISTELLDHVKENEFSITISIIIASTRVQNVKLHQDMWIWIQTCIEERIHIIFFLLSKKVIVIAL